tara:strand:+ start:1060 stop:1311 length:252 start_codon:yes stop_codon:yes gene_type:complete
MSETSYKGSYESDKIAKDMIDKVLRKCATIYSNLGTNTPFDVGTKEEAKRLEKEYLLEIEAIDPGMYNLLTRTSDTNEEKTND